MDFRVLGPIEVRDGDQTVPIGGPKQRSILAFLIASMGQPLSLDRIVDGIYDEDTAGKSRHSVQTFISALRRDLGEVIHKEGNGYVLQVPPDSVDAIRFQTRVDQALAIIDKKPDEASALLNEGLGMWRGHPYADVDGRGAFEAEISRLNELRLIALETRIDADLESGRHRELVGELDALIIEHPLQERFRAQHMVALYRSGRQTEALRAYTRLREYLADEIGVEPSPELTLLEDRILNHDNGLALASRPEVTRRAILVMEAGGQDSLARLPSSDRMSILEAAVSIVSEHVTAHDGELFAQRGTTFYSAFPGVGEAARATRDIVGDIARALPEHPRLAIDVGDVEMDHAGDLIGPPVRRCAGMVAAANPGQVLLSDEAQTALTADGETGWLVRSLGGHVIYGVENEQRIHELVLDPKSDGFPALRIGATPAPMPVDRRAIAGYEIRESIGGDLLANYYRAYQPSVGREVVVSVIDPVWANEPDFVLRFEVQTQIVTRLQHPHITPIIDYWRDPSGAFLVSPSLPGGTLSSATGSLRVFAQITSAVAHAHANGAVHGSISPNCIGLDRAGNAYLHGPSFISRLAGAPRSRSRYDAPEQTTSDATEEMDVYSVGALGVELVEGDESQIPTGLRSLLDRAMSADPGARPTLKQLHGAAQALIGETDPADIYTSTRNPYKGLGAFTESDAGDFFGRDDSVEILIDKLRAHRLVAVVGPSGSGKSSLVRAGVIPTVREGLIDDSRWVVADLIPGSYPFEELESALLRVAIDDPGSLIDELERNDRGVARVIKRILPEGTRLLLVIDQFEELFTLTRSDQDRTRFLEMLIALCADPSSRTRVVLTLRADFFDRPLQHSEFGELLRDGMHALTSPTPNALSEAIRRPAEGLGVSWEPGLVDQIIEDLGTAPGALPLLQYSLTELFESRGTDLLTLDGYRASGGVLGALGTRADDIYGASDLGTQLLTRQVFLRLVTVQPGGEPTRRRVRLPELHALGDPAMVDAVMAAFGGARLLTFDRDPVSRGPTVEVAHEALLSRWPRLAGWIDGASEDLLLHRRFTEAASEWEEHEHEPGYLLTGGRLAQFETWASASDLTLTGAEHEFLRLGRERTDQRRARRRRARNLVTAGLGTAALVAGFFWLQSARNENLAQSRELAASAISVLDRDPELSLLLALESTRAGDTPIESFSALHAALGAHKKVMTYQWPSDKDVVELGIALSPPGDLLVASGMSQYIEVVEVSSGAVLWNHTFAGEGLARATFTPDGTRIVVIYGWLGDDPADEETGSDLGVHVLDAETGKPIAHFGTGPCGALARFTDLTVLDAPTGYQLIAGLSEGPNCSVREPDLFAIDLETGTTSVIRDGDNSAYFSADGRLALTGYLEPVFGRSSASHVIDRRSGRELEVLPGAAADISPNGTLAATIVDSGLAIFDIDDIDELLEPDVSLGATWWGWFTPDSKRLWTSIGDDRLDLVEAATGERVLRLRTGLGSTNGLSQSADGTRIVAFEGGTTGVVFDLSRAAEIDEADFCEGSIPQTSSLVGGGGYLLTDCAHTDNPTTMSDAILFDMSSLETTQFENHRSTLSSDGSLLAAQQLEPPGIVENISLFDPSTGALIDELTGLCSFNDYTGMPLPGCREYPETPFPDTFWDLRFSSDNRFLAMAPQNTPDAIVWDLASRKIVATPGVGASGETADLVTSVVFDPTSESFVAFFFSFTGPGRLIRFSTSDWTEIGRYDEQDPGLGLPPNWKLQYTPDGKMLIGTDVPVLGLSRLIFIDAETLDVIGAVHDAHTGGVGDLDISSDGRLVASAGVDGYVRIWDIETRRLVHQIPVPGDGGAGGVAFLGGSHIALTSIADGDLRVMTYDTTELLEIARSRLTRTFSSTECTTYHVDPCPTLDEIRAG